MAHLKRYFAPKTWNIKRKGIKFTTKPSPGSHGSSLSLPLNIILRDMLMFAKNNKEVRYLLEHKNITVNGIKRNDHRFPVGLFDVLSLNDLDEHYRVILDNRGKLNIIKIKKTESLIKPSKITGKTLVGGKVQLNLHDGNNIRVPDKKYKTGDTLLIAFGSKNQIKEHIGFGKNILIYLTGGKHTGQVGNVQDIIGNRIIYKTENGEVVETLKKYAFTIGKDKSLISLA
jgi:small subunit ribosomal protein S4e